MGGGIGNLGRGATLCSLRQHFIREGSQAGLLDRIRVTPVQNEQVSNYDGELVLLNQHHSQSVRKFEAGGNGQSELTGRLRRRDLGAPRLIRHCASYRFAFRSGLFFGLWRVVHHAIARHTVDHGTGRRLQLLRGDPLHVFDRDAVIALEIFGQVSRVVKKLIVLIEAISQSTKAAQPFETADHPGLDQIAGALEFCLGWPLRAQRVQFVIDRFFQIFRLHAWLGGRLQLED